MEELEILLDRRFIGDGRHNFMVIVSFRKEDRYNHMLQITVEPGVGNIYITDVIRNQGDLSHALRLITDYKRDGWTVVARFPDNDPNKLINTAVVFAELYYNTILNPSKTPENLTLFETSIV